MRDTKDIQHDLDTAQDDLERDLAELKDVIEEKIEGPKHVVEAFENAVEKPLSFMRDHGVLIGVGVVFALGLLVGRMTTSSER
jgi:ElaB/YqjD/DUF883 family membrane-anchored ribosome-binding protein